MENNKIEFVTTKMVIDTYNRIANWVNNPYDNERQQSDALKIVSQEIVQNILDELVKGMGAKSGTDVYRGDVKVGDIETIKDPESFNKISEKDVFDKLFIKDEPKKE